MRESFVDKLRLNKSNVALLRTINAIIEDYSAQSYTLTLRQLYYQLVSKNIIANDDKEYKKLGGLLVNGRMSGVVDWEAIEDRVRVPKIPFFVDDIADALRIIQEQYRLDRLIDQDKYIEVWVEKDALSSVFYRVTSKYHIRLMVNRGYTSVTAIYDAYKRFVEQMKQGKEVVVLYCGDHDPSGLDMIRDVRERLEEMLSNSNELIDWILDDERRSDLYNDHFDDLFDLYSGDKRFNRKDDGQEVFEWYKTYFLEKFHVKHVGLTTEQVKKYNPPPNPAKIKDARAKNYIKRFGQMSWELDALNPKILTGLIEDAIKKEIDLKKYKEMVKLELEGKDELGNLVDQYKEDN